MRAAWLAVCCGVALLLADRAEGFPYTLEWKRLVRGPVALAWADSTLYVGQVDGELVALRPADGTPVWVRRDHGPIRQPPALSGNLLIVSDAWGQVRARDRRTGKERWLGPPGLGEAEAVAGDSLVYLGSADGWTHALRRRDGTEAWRLLTGSRRASAPAIAGRWVFAAAPGEQLVAAEAGSGAHRGSTRLAAAVQGPALPLGALLYVACEDGYLRCLDAATLDRRWERRLGAVPMGRPLAVAGALVLAAANGFAYGVGPEDGRVIWRQPLGARPSGPPVVGLGPEVIVATEKGLAVGLDPRTGDRRWEQQVLSATGLRVHAQADRLLCSADDGYLYAFRRLDAWPPEGADTLETWWDLLESGRKVGYARSWSKAGPGRSAASGTDVVTWASGFVRTRSETRADEGHRPVSSVRRRIEDSQVLETRARWRGSRVEVTQKLAGHVDRCEVRLDVGVQAPELALGWLDARGRPLPGHTDSVRVFDPDEIAVRTLIVTVEPLPQGERLVRTRYRGDGDQPLLERMEMLTWLGPEGRERRSLIPATAWEQVRVERTQALSWSAPAPSRSTCFDLPIGDPTRVDRLELRLPDGLQDPQLLLAQDERQFLQPDGTGGLRLVIRRVPWAGPALQVPVRDPAAAPFLVPTLYTQSGDDRVRQLSRRLVGGERDAWRIACRLAEWVHDHVVPAETRVRFQSALEVLDGMAGNCSEYAALYIALCQASGVPARACTGLVPSRSGELLLHIWAQVFVGQWVDVDPTWGELAVDAAHIRSSQGPLRPAALARLNLPVQLLLAGADTLRVVGYEAQGSRHLGAAESLLAAAQEADRTFDEGRAQELYAELLRLPWNARSGEAAVEIGRYHQRRRQWPQADSAFAQVVRSEPDGAAAGQARFYLARSAEEQGDTLQARQRLRALVERHPDHDLADDALGRLAELVERQEGCGQAVPVYERVREEYPRSGWAQVAAAAIERCARRSGPQPP